MKLCIKCGKTKDESEFHNSSFSKDGKFIYCRECECERSRIKRSDPVQLKKMQDNYRKRYAEDIEYRLKCIVHFRLRMALRRRKLKYNIPFNMVEHYLGCSLASYKKYLEKKFTGDMGWGSMGVGKIEIDHIKPISSFDISTEQGMLAAFNYKNTQPLWAVDNLSKRKQDKKYKEKK